MSNVAVVADAVRVVFDGVSLLAPTSFRLGVGEALAVTGSNGSGKTTLLRVLAGMQRLSAGSVSVADQVPNPKEPGFRRCLAALIGMPPLARNLTLAEQLALVAASWGDSVPDARAHAAQALAEFEIGRLSQRYVHELSSGQTQLFALALTLIRPCEVLLLDEPEQRLDPERRALLAAALRSRREAGVTLVLASHSPELVQSVCDRTLQLVETVEDFGEEA